LNFAENIQVFHLTDHKLVAPINYSTLIAYLSDLVDLFRGEFDVLQIRSVVLVVQLHPQHRLSFVFQVVQLRDDLSTEFFSFTFEFLFNPIYLK